MRVRVMLVRMMMLVAKVLLSKERRMKETMVMTGLTKRQTLTTR